MKALYSFLFILSLILISCTKDEAPEIQFEFDFIPIGESQLKVNWNEDEIRAIVIITIDTDSLFKTPIVTKETEVVNKTILLDGLEPITQYFIKIEIKKNDKIIWEETGEFTSSYTTKSVKYHTSDGEEICATLAYVSTKLSTSSKKAIFMHEYGRNQSRWLMTSIPEILIKKGYICVSFDFRGHGCSTYSKDITYLLDYPWEVKKDFDATLNYLDTINLECSNKIIVLGASLGACVATAASTYENVLGGVALSAVQNISTSMHDSDLNPKGMFFIAGELDQNEDFYVDCAQDANNLYQSADSPKKLEIVKNTANHGVDLLKNNSELVTKIINWVKDL